MNFGLRKTENLYNKKTLDFSDMLTTKNVTLSATAFLNGDNTVDNLNTVVVGSVGTGKTRGFVNCNILNAGCSFVISDVKGELYHNFNDYLKKCGYKVKIINLIDTNCSLHYNPFKYIHSESDILVFSEALVSNSCTGEKDFGNSDRFWTDAKRLLITCLVSFVIEYYEPQERTVNKLLDLLNRFDNLRDTFSDIEMLGIDSFALKYWQKFGRLLGNDYSENRTVDCILAEVGTSFSRFETRDLRELFSYDDIELENIGEKKTAIFIIIDECNPCYNFVCGLIYTQLFNNLFHKALIYGGKLPEHTRFILDDFANLGYIPNIDKFIASARSRNISIEIIIQSEIQLKSIYGIMADNIIANCTYMYLGGNDITTEENVSKRLGCSLKKIQESENKCYIFYPNGISKIDKIADFTNHINYKYWITTQKETPLYNFRECFENPILREDKALYSLIEKRFETKYVTEYESSEEQESFWENESQKYASITSLKTTLFDSKEEEIFYSSLVNFFDTYLNLTDYEIIIHSSLKDIFNFDPVYEEEEKSGFSHSYYFKGNNMHCDFLIRDRHLNPVCGIEIDGVQHDDIMQKRNDFFKDELFRNNNLKLFRFSAESVRNNIFADMKTIQLYLNENAEKF